MIKSSIVIPQNLLLFDGIGLPEVPTEIKENCLLSIKTNKNLRKFSKNEENFLKDQKIEVNKIIKSK